MSSISAIGMTSALDAAKDLHAASAGTQGVAGNGAPSSGSDPAADARDAFSSLLADARPAAPAGSQPPRRGILGSGNGLGDQVLGALEKMGRSMETFNAMGSAPPPAPGAPAGERRAAARAPRASRRALHDMWQSGMQQQKQLYATVFEFELVEESSQSMMKSLKSLLTQGGG